MLFYGGNARHDKARVASNRSKINRKTPFEILITLKVLKRLFQHVESLAEIDWGLFSWQSQITVKGAYQT